jgi:hypothetical protein
MTAAMANLRIIGLGLRDVSLGHSPNAAALNRPNFLG